MYYDHYKSLANNENGLRLLKYVGYNMLRIVTNLLGYVFLTNFRSMFLIFVIPQNRARMLTKAYECLAIMLQSLRIGGQLHF